MTPTKTSNQSSAFGAGVKRMPTDSDDLDWSTPQENTPEVDDGVNLLSTLLLSLILKLEDREYRVKEDHPARRRAKSANESSDRSRQRRFDDYDNMGALVMREDSTQWDYSSDSNTEDIGKVGDDDHHDTTTEWRSERSHFPNDPTRPNYNQITQRDSLTGSSSSGLSRVRSDVSEDMLTPSPHTSEDDVTLTSLCKQSEGSVYRDSAVHIVGDAMLRAIANIFTNGVIRRGVRTYGITIWSLTDYQHSTISHGYKGQPRIPTSEGMRQIKPKPGRVSSEWLDDVNRRIAAPEVTTVSYQDSMPPSVASSCNVSRCSSVDILSSGDRALKVKAIHPSQSKLLWRAVQKSHGSNDVKKPVDDPDLTPVFVPVYDGSAKEKKVELSKALERVRESTPRKRFWGEKITDVETIEDGTCLKVDRLVKFRDSTAQTEKKDLQKDGKSTCDDDVTDYKEKIREAKSPPYSVQTDERVTTEVDRLVKFRDSTAQTEKKDLQKDGKSACDDDVTDYKEKIREAKSPPYSVQTDERVTTEEDRLVKFRDSAAQTEKKDLQTDGKSTCGDDVTDNKENIREAKSQPYSVQTDERVTTEVDRLVKFRDSAAQTEKKDLQKDGKSTCDDDVTDYKEKIGEAKSPPYSVQTDERVTTDRPVKFRDSAAQTEKKDLQKDGKPTCDDDVTYNKENIREAKSLPYSVQTDERVTTEVDRFVKFRDSAAQTEKKDLQKDGKSTCDDDVTYNKENIREAKSPPYSVQTDERVTTEVDRFVKFRDSAAQTEKKDLQKDGKSTCDDDVTDNKENIREAKSPPYSVQTDERVMTEVDRLVKFRDSAAQTEKKDLQKDGKSTCDDDVTDYKEKIREAKSPPYSVQTDERVATEVSTAQTNQVQEPTLQVKQLNVPPIASPLLMDVVWRHASDMDMTDQEKRHFKAHFARGGARETERAKGVVKSAVRRAVSEVFVDRVISDSLESLTSLGELRITPSFKKAAADLTQGPPLQFEWFPYLEGSAGPCKVTDRRRQRADRIGKAKIQPNIMGVSGSSEVYEDAREKFGSSEDLKGQVNSSEDEFADAVCESDCAECQVSATKPSTIDKATQVSHTAYGKDSSGSPSDDIEDEQQSPAVQLELPMESINYIKDQFEDVKVLVAKYRELLYEPLDESVPVGSRAQPQINPDEEQTSDLRDVNTLQIKPGLDETDEDDDDVVARKPKRKHTKDEKDIKQAEEKSTKIEKQSEKQLKDKAKEKTEKGKKENKESFPEGREAALANQDTSNKDEENAALTHEQQVADRHPKVKDKRKKRDDSPTRDKTSVRRTLRKTGDKMRTPTGRQRFGKTVLEKTTGDGFLSLKVKVEPDNSLESEMKTGTNELLKSGATSSRKAEDKLTTPLKPTGEDKPKVKNHISFFEKFSKHSLKRSDQTTSSSNSPSPEPDTTIKREAHNVDKLERFSHSESMTQNDEMKRRKDSGKRDKQVNPESCVDSTPGKGIWTNRAFFEALSESDDQTVLTSEPPKTAKRILEDGLLDEPGNEDGQPGPSLKTKKEISRRERSTTTSPEKTDEKRKSPSSRRKKKSRNKNTNNELLIDQVTTDDSCISDSQCSCADTTANANGKIAVDGLLSSNITNCDDETITNAKNTTTCHNSGSDEVEKTVQTTEIIPKLTSGRLNIDEAETTEDRRNSSSLCGDSRIENEDDAVLLHNITPHQRLSSERVNSGESTTTETRCVSSSPRSDTETEKEEALLSHNVTPHQRLSSESLNSGKASISKSPSNHIELENEEYELKSNEIIFDQKPSSESLSHIDGPSGGHSHFQMDHDQDETNTVNMKENILKKSQSTESVTEYGPQTPGIKTKYGITTDLDDDSVVLKTQNHHTNTGQVISGELTEEDNATSVGDLLDDLSLNGDLSREVQIHSPPPTGETDDVSSLNNLDVPLLTSSPHPHRRPKKSNTSSMESIEKGGVPDQTPPILRNKREEEEDVNDGDEDSGDDFLHHLRNTSFLLACNPDCYVSKDQPNQDVQIEEDMDKRKTQDEQEKITSNRPMENPQSQSEIQQDGVNIFKVSAQPKSELRSNVCQALISDGEQEAGSKVNSSVLESERRKHGEQKSCLRFSLLRKSKKRSRSKKTSLGQSEGKQQPSSDSDRIPQDETHTASKVEEEDAVAVVTKECTNEGVDTSTDSNPTPPGSQKRKFRLKYLRKSKKQKASSKT